MATARSSARTPAAETAHVTSDANDRQFRIRLIGIAPSDAPPLLTARPRGNLMVPSVNANWPGSPASPAGQPVPSRRARGHRRVRDDARHGLGINRLGEMPIETGLSDVALVLRIAPPGHGNQQYIRAPRLSAN